MKEHEPSKDQMSQLESRVGLLLRRVGAEVVMPRYRKLASGEAYEKSAGEVVTVADLEAEAALAAALTKLLPGSRVLGEEGHAKGEASLDLVSSGSTWIIDPIDGTANYAAGAQPFGMMVALVADGRTQAGWIFEPVRNRLFSALLSRGAYLDGVRYRGPQVSNLQPICALSRTLPATLRKAAEEGAREAFRCTEVPGCAAEQYARILLGLDDVAYFWRTLVWDHAAGALILNEAGGKVARPDGDAYMPTATRSGLLAARSDQLWARAATAFLGG